MNYEWPHPSLSSRASRDTKVETDETQMRNPQMTQISQILFFKNLRKSAQSVDEKSKNKKFTAETRRPEEKTKMENGEWKKGIVLRFLRGLRATQKWKQMKCRCGIRR